MGGGKQINADQIRKIISTSECREGLTQEEKQLLAGISKRIEWRPLVPQDALIYARPGEKLPEEIWVVRTKNGLEYRRTRGEALEIAIVAEIEDENLK